MLNFRLSENKFFYRKSFSDIEFRYDYIFNRPLGNLLENSISFMINKLENILNTENLDEEVIEGIKRNICMGNRIYDNILDTEKYDIYMTLFLFINNLEYDLYH